MGLPDGRPSFAEAANVAQIKGKTETQSLKKKARRAKGSA